MKHYYIFNYHRDVMDVIYEFYGDEETARGFLSAFEKQNNKKYLLMEVINV